MHSRNKLDCGVLSEPLMLMNLLYIYRSSSDKHDLCLKYGLAHVKMRQINNSYTHLLTRISDILRNEKNNKNFRGKDHSKFQKKGMGGTPEELDIVNTPRFYNNTTSSKMNRKNKRKSSIVPSQVLGYGKNKDNNEMNDNDEEEVDNHEVSVEEFYLKSLGSAKRGLLRILLTWIFHDQVIMKPVCFMRLYSVHSVCFCFILFDFFFNILFLLYAVFPALYVFLLNRLSVAFYR